MAIKDHNDAPNSEIYWEGLADEAANEKFQFKSAFGNGDFQVESSLCLREIVSQIASISYLTAATTDIAKAVGDGIFSRDRYAELQLYLPSGAVNFPEAISELINLVQNDFLLGDLITLPSRMRFALKIARTLATNPQDGRISEAAFCDAWTYVASGLVEAIVLCDHLQNKQHKVFYDFGTTLNLLEDVLADKKPCIDGHNEISIPNWAERRAAKRYKCNVPVWIATGANLQVATIRDFSLTGLGLSGCYEVQEGAEISIQRKDAKVLSGRIVWKKESRIGVKLDQSLLSDDPLIRSLRN